MDSSRPGEPGEPVGGSSSPPPSQSPQSGDQEAAAGQPAPYYQPQPPAQPQPQPQQQPYYPPQQPAQPVQPAQPYYPPQQPTQPYYPPPQPTQPVQPAQAPTQPYYPPPQPQPQQPTQPYPQGYGTQDYRPQGSYPPPPAQTPQQPPVYQQPYAAPPPGSPPPGQYPYGPPPGGSRQVNVQNVQKRSSPLPIILGVIVLLIAAGFVAWYFLINKSGTNILGGSTGSEKVNATVERSLPVDALGYFSINTSPGSDQQSAFNKMKDAFQSQPGFNEAVSRLTSGLNNGLSSSTGLCGTTTSATPQGGSSIDSLLSYFGKGLSLAVLKPSQADLDSLKNSGSSSAGTQVVQKNLVALVDLDFNAAEKSGPIADFKTATQNLSKLPVATTYQGMDIRKYTCGSTTLYFTLLTDSNTAVVAADTAPIQKVIDQYKGSSSLKDDTAFKYLSGKVPADRVVTLYLNLTEIFDLSTQLGATQSSSTPRADGAVLMTISGQDGGLQLDVATQADVSTGSTLMGAQVQVDPNKRPDASTIADIPTDALGFVVGTDLQSILTTALDAMRKQNPDQVSSLEQQVTSMTGLDLEKDILPLMSGDFSLSVSSFDVASLQSGNTTPPIVFQMKLNSGDRDKAANVLKTIMDKLTQGRGDSISFQAGGGTFYDLSKLSSTTNVSFGVSSDRLIVAYTGSNRGQGSKSADLVNSVISNIGKGFGTTDKWKTASGHLPTDSNVIMYVDLDNIRNLAEAAMGALSPDTKSQYDQMAAPFVRPFKFLLIGSATEATGSGNRSRNLTRLFIGISK